MKLQTRKKVHESNNGDVSTLRLMVILGCTYHNLNTSKLQPQQF